MPDFEVTEGLPGGLLLCTLDGEEFTHTRISPRAVWLRMAPGRMPQGKLQLSFYRSESGLYRTLDVPDYRAERYGEDRYCCEYVLRLPESCGLQAELRRIAAEYARFVRWKSGLDAENAFPGMPEEQDADEIPASEAAWKQALFSRFPRENWRSALQGVPELALLLNRPSLWRSFLTLPPADFMRAYAERALPGGGFPAERLPDRLYIGDAYCALLFPDDALLARLLERAGAQGLGVSLVVSGQSAAGIAQWSARIARLAAQGYRPEIIAGDWGIIEPARRAGLAVALGVPLNRFRCDPRMRHKSGAAEHAELLRSNMLNDPACMEFLRGRGVERFEYESCGRRLELPQAHASLHLPYFCTNSSRWCTLRACVERGDRGAQSSDARCPAYCEDHFLLYPRAAGLIGRGSGLSAPDIRRLENPRWPGEDYDRWVLNF